MLLDWIISVGFMDRCCFCFFFPYLQLCAEVSLRCSILYCVTCECVIWSSNLMRGKFWSGLANAMAAPWDASSACRRRNGSAWIELTCFCIQIGGRAIDRKKTVMEIFFQACMAESVMHKVWNSIPLLEFSENASWILVWLHCHNSNLMACVTNMAPFRPLFMILVIEW